MTAARAAAAAVDLGMPDVQVVADALGALSQTRSLGLTDAEVRRVAEVAVAAIEAHLVRRGFRYALDSVQTLRVDTERYLVEPARQRAQAGQDPQDTVSAHIDYLAGMTAVRDHLRQILGHLDRTSGPAQHGQPTRPSEETA